MPPWAKSALLKGVKKRIPRFNWHLELTSKCALACPRCTRQELQAQGLLHPQELSLELLQRRFSPEFIRQEMQRLLLCGSLGDPIYHSNLPGVLRHFKTANPELQISIVTNGSYRKPEWWQAVLAELNEHDTITFSVDGASQEQNQKYRVKSDFPSILEGVRAAVASRVTVFWSTIVFQFNQDNMKEIVELARSLGVQYFDIARSNKFGPTWWDASGLDSLAPDEKFQAQGGQYQKIRIPLNPKPWTPSAYQRSHAQAVTHTKTHYAHADIEPVCLQGSKGFYVEANGSVLPCSWMAVDPEWTGAENKNSRNRRGPSVLRENRARLQLHERSLEAILEDPLWDTFLADLDHGETRLSTCTQKCGKFTAHKEVAGSVSAPLEV